MFALLAVLLLLASLLLHASVAVLFSWRLLAFLLLLVALLEVLLAGVSAIACVCGGSVRPCWHAGILVIVGHSLGGVAIAVVSAIACCLC